MDALSETVAVVGAGVMGRGIAQLFVQAGFPVRLFDLHPGAASAGREFILNMLDRQVAKGTIDGSMRQVIAERLVVVDALERLAGATLLVEAIVEDLGAKQALFRDLETVLGEQAILASNTSSLTVSAIASVCRRPQRVAGLHFFNPVPLMKIAEIIPGLRTDPAVTGRLEAFVAATGHRGVTAADQPGFLINHAGRALYTEGFRIVEEGVADFSTVDRVLRESCGFRMGPFELLDLTGLDVSGKVMQSIYDQFQQDPWYRPSSLVPPRIAAGLFGRKSGRGFYDYAQPISAAEDLVPAAEPGSVWIEDAPERAGIAALLETAGARISTAAGNADVLLVLPLGEDATAAAVRLGIDPARMVALDPVVPIDRRQVLMTPPGSDRTAARRLMGWLAVAGRTATLIEDSTGFIAQRVLAMIVNIGCEIAQRRIATPRDIDTAVQIGLGYPQGPLALGDSIGAARVLAILQRMQALSGDPRYRPSPWLRRRAALGLSLAG